MRSATDRAHTQDQIGRALGRYHQALRKASSRMGLPTFDELGPVIARVPVEGAIVHSLLEEVKTLAETLSHQERLQRDMLEKTKGCVAGYLHALRPNPTAYDARGRSAQARMRMATQSRRA